MAAKFTGPTFPSYFLLNEHGNPETAEVDGKLSLCVFSGQAQINAFYQAKYGADFESRAVKVRKFGKKAELIDVLAQSEAELAEQNCKHVAFDPAPDQPTHYAAIRDLLVAKR